MKFTNYPSIENSNPKAVDKIFKEAGSDSFVIQEKINGEPFAIYMNGNTYKYANKDGFIETDKTYFNYRKIVDPLQQNFINLYNKIVEKYNKNDVIFYGTLCGGEYNESTVDKVDEQIKIRTGVDYSPKNLFVGIDIKINGRFLAVDIAMNFYEGFKIPFSRTIVKGNLYECLKMNTEFQTTLPTDFLLPAIENNQCKGIVVKLNVPLENGSRPSLQKINKPFEEKDEV